MVPRDGVGVLAGVLTKETMPSKEELRALMKRKREERGTAAVRRYVELRSDQLASISQVQR